MNIPINQISETWEVGTWILNPMQVGEWINQDGESLIPKRWRDED